MKMSKIYCLGSGSKGNSYAIDDGRSVLLLEAGLPASRILSGYRELLPRVAGCLITHEHSDHAKGVAELARRGIDLYLSQGTKEGLSGVRNPFALHTVRAYDSFRLYEHGNPLWTILPWEAQHDAAEPLGFLIQSCTTGEKILFATDTCYIPNTFRGLHVIMVECNYSREHMQRAIDQGYTDPRLLQRLESSHFGLHNVKAMLAANDLSQVSHIYLLHVSYNNGDKRGFETTIRAMTGIPVTAF